MSLDLYEIGASLILDDGISASLDRVIGKVTALQEASDRAKNHLSFANSAVAELSGLSGNFAGSWTEAAEAAERVVDAAGKAHMMAPWGGRFQSGANSAEIGPRAGGEPIGHRASSGKEITDTGILGRLGAPYNQAFGMRHYENSIEVDGFSALDATNATGVSQPQRKGGFDLSRDDGTAAIWDSFARATNGNDAHGKADAPAPTVQLATSAGLAQMLEDIHKLIHDRIDEHSAESTPIEPSVNQAQGAELASGQRITPQNYHSIVQGTSHEPLRMDDSAFADFGAGASGADAYKIASSGSGPAEERNKARFGRDTFGTDWGGSLRVAPSLSSDDLHTQFDTTNSAKAYDAAYLSQAGALQQSLAAQGALTAQPGSFLNNRLEKEGPVAAVDTSYATSWQHHSSETPQITGEGKDEMETMSRTAGWTGLYPRFGSAEASVENGHAEAPAELLRRGSSHAFGNHDATGNLTGGEGSEAAQLSAADRIAGAFGPPGWLVALTGAVVRELASSGLYNHTGASGGTVSNQQTQPAPNGTRNDPLHVKVVDQMVSYQTHMPAGPTASLPSQSLPIPGQVLFSP